MSNGVIKGASRPVSNGVAFNSESCEVGVCFGVAFAHQRRRTAMAFLTRTLQRPVPACSAANSLPHCDVVNRAAMLRRQVETRYSVLEQGINMQPENWLVDNVHGYSNLTHEEKEEIKYFALLWSLFEFKMVNNFANPTSIVALCESMDQPNPIDLAAFTDPFDYFRNRYYGAQGVTYAFTQLHFRPNDRQALVESVLAAQPHTNGHILAAFLLIVYRLRNNLFHGEKWKYEIQGQLDNFRNANAVLMATMDL